MNNSSSGTGQIASAAEEVVDSLRKFLHTETASSILLLAATIAALIAAKTPLFSLYEMSGLVSSGNFCPEIPDCPAPAR